jgi:hypothetical protein
VSPILPIERIRSDLNAFDRMISGGRKPARARLVAALGPTLAARLLEELVPKHEPFFIRRVG